MPSRKHIARLAYMNRKPDTIPKWGFRKLKKYGPPRPTKAQLAEAKAAEAGTSRESASTPVEMGEPSASPENWAIIEGLSDDDQSSDAQKSGASSNEYVSLCKVFLYELHHFEKVGESENGNSFYEAIRQFIKVPAFTNADQVKRSIDHFYSICNLEALKDRVKLNIKDWAENEEILAAATLFQRTVYVFRERDAPNTGRFDVYKIAPMFDRSSEWQVYGEPEFSIVLLRHKPISRQKVIRGRKPTFFFDAMHLKRREASNTTISISKPNCRSVSPPPKLRRVTSRSRSRSKSPSPQPSSQSTTHLAPQLKDRIIEGLQQDKIRLEGEKLKLKGENVSVKQKNRIFFFHNAKLRQDLIRSRWIYRMTRREVVELKETAKKLREKIKEDHGKQFVGYAEKPGDTSLLRIRQRTSDGRYKLYHNIPQARVPTTEASSAVLTDRLKSLTSVIKILASRDQSTLEQATLVGHYLKRNYKVLKAIRVNDVKGSGIFLCSLNAADTLDLIYDLNLTWAQARRLRTTLNSHNLNCLASEGKVREEIVRREIITKMREETIPIREIKDGVVTSVNRVCHRAPNLVEYIKEMYERCLKHNVMRNDVNFGDKIWIAIGGDKGGTTTKIVFSFGNAAKTNSFNNLHILAMYEGDDSEANLRQVLSLYESEWEQLQSLRLPAPFQKSRIPIEAACSGTLDQSSGSVDSRNPSVTNAVETVLWPVRVILFGDMLFLARMMGLSGASSSAPCIFCTVKREQLKKLKKGSFEKISMASSRDLKQWDVAMESGEKSMQILAIKSKPILPFEIYDINPPVLHIMLGVGTDLLGKIEEACFQRDLALGADVNASKEYKRMCKLVVDKTHDYDEAVQQHKQARHILEYIVIDINADDDGNKKKKRQGNCAALICLSAFFGRQTNSILCNECGSRYHLECCLKISLEERETIVSNDDDEWTCPKCDESCTTKNEIRDDASTLCQQLKNVEDEFRVDLEAAIKRRDDVYAVVKEKQGAATSSLNEAMNQLGVDRQAFQGGLLIGNHIQKLITGEGPRLATQCLDGDTREQKDERELFREMLSTLGQIVGLMCVSRFLTDEEIDRLGSLCRRIGEVYEKFEFYRNDQSITPKMHALVHHVPEFARRNKTVGLISEHGLEHMHARLNRIARRYACVRDMHLKMRAMIKQHSTEASALGRLRHDLTLKK